MIAIKSTIRGLKKCGNFDVSAQCLKYIYVLFEFKQTEVFTSRGSYMLIITIIIIIILLLMTHKFAYACIWPMRVTEIGWFKFKKKRVLTKDFKVAEFFSCLMWRGRAKTSSRCRIFSSRSRSRNFRLLSIWKFF